MLSKHLNGYLDKVIRSLVLILLKMSEYVKTFRVEDEDENKNNEFMSFRRDYKKLLEEKKNIWTKIEDLNNTELNDLPFYDDKYIKTKIKTFGDKVYTNFRGLNVPEVNIAFE